MSRRVALVTGAARGIGAATVSVLSSRGYDVVAVDACQGDDGPAGYPLATVADLEALSAEHVRPVLADVTDRAALEEVARRAVETYGRLDAVVAAAAVIAGGRPLWQAPEAELRLLLDVDVEGVWNTAAATVPLMLDGPDPAGCRFVAVASAAGHDGLPRLAAYTVAKHAVVGLVRGLAADLAGTGVTAVAVSPGSTRTAMLQASARVYDLDSTDDFTRSALLGRLLEAEEVAETIAFCCSPEAAALNGSVVHADGGFRP